MFEQTFAAQAPRARKTGALAISFMAQSCILGVLIIGPLLYTNALPLVIPKLELPLFVRMPSTPDPPREQTRSQPSSTTMPSVSRVFHMPDVRRVPTGPIPATITEEVPAIFDSAPVGAPIGATSSTPFLPNVVAEIPRVEIVKPVVAPPEQLIKPTAISSVVLASKLVSRVVPQYPDIARRARISGTVRLLAVIGKDGRVQNLRVLEGHPMLRQAALNAVKQWVYTPTYLGGQPIEVEAGIEVNFTLN